MLHSNPGPSVGIIGTAEFQMHWSALEHTKRRKHGDLRQLRRIKIADEPAFISRTRRLRQFRETLNLGRLDDKRKFSMDYANGWTYRESLHVIVFPILHLKITSATCYRGVHRVTAWTRGGAWKQWILRVLAYHWCKLDIVRSHCLLIVSSSRFIFIHIFIQYFIYYFRIKGNIFIRA